MSATRVRESADLPGPHGLPLLGIATKLQADQIHLQLEDWYREYGGPFSFRLGPKRYVAFGDADTVSEVLKRRPDDFRRGARLASVIEELGVHGLFTAEGADWRRQRKVTAPAFNQNRLRRFFPKLQVIAERLQRVLRTAADAGGAWDCRNDFENFATDATTSLVFGLDTSTLEGHPHALQADIDEVFPGLNRRLVSTVPLWRYVKLPQERRLEAAGDRLEARIRPIIADVRKRLLSDPAGVDPDRAETLLEAMILDEMAGEDVQQISDEEIYGNMVTLLFAGEDTTAHTLAWVAHALASEPEVQSKLQAELDGVLGDAPGVREFEDIQRLPYVNGVVQEALRLRSVVPMMFHEPREPTCIGDVRVQPGEVVVVLTRHCAVQESNFSEATRFLPERWMRDGAPSRCPVHQPKAMMPFGAGPRICPGRGLALLEMQVAVARLGRNFEVEAIGDPHAVKEQFALTMHPLGLQLRLKPRR